MSEVPWWLLAWWLKMFCLFFISSSCSAISGLGIALHFIPPLSAFEHRVFLAHSLLSPPSTIFLHIFAFTSSFPIPIPTFKIHQFGWKTTFFFFFAMVPWVYKSLEISPAAFKRKEVAQLDVREVLIGGRLGAVTPRRHRTEDITPEKRAQGWV